MLKRAASEAAGEKQPETYPLGYVEDCFEPRTKLAARFSFLLLHVPIFSQQLHPSSLILRAAGSFRDGRVPQFFNNIVHVLGGRLDRRRAGRAPQAPIARTVALVKVEVNKGNILELDVFPNVDFGPVQ